jgi:hypothetical protein
MARTLQRRDRLVHVEDEIAAANDALRAKGYSERHLGVHPAPGGRALLKGDRIVAPFSDEPATILRVVAELVPPASELKGQLRPAELRARMS